MTHAEKEEIFIIIFIHHNMTESNLNNKINKERHVLYHLGLVISTAEYWLSESHSVHIFVGIGYMTL